jgi:hypothetical protein
MRFLASLIASASFALAVLAVLYGTGGLAGDSARVWMRTWEEQRYVNDAEQWERAYQRLLLARRLDLLSADHSAALGRLMEWRSWRHSPGDPEFTRTRGSAEKFYEEAIRRRPTWGFAWANYAENRLLQGKLDESFLRSLEEAMTLAPWEPWVQRKVAWMGMATWGELPVRLREKVRENIRRAVDLENFPYEIVRLAVQYDWLDELKPMLRTERQIAALEFVLTRLEAQ